MKDFMNNDPSSRNGQFNTERQLALCREENEYLRGLLKRRNSELALLLRSSQAFTDRANLSDMLRVVLEETADQLNASVCSIWLRDDVSGDLVCSQVIGPESERVRGWRLSPETGLVGWVVSHGESLIVPDVTTDTRHFEGVEKTIGVIFKSVLTVPLRVKHEVTGCLQVLSEEANRFDDGSVELVESLAGMAGIAMENTRLYVQAKEDADTKSILLREINHRVKNNLSAIIGLLYAEKRNSGIDDDSVYQTIMHDLISRVQGLSTVHSMLSASMWQPLKLSDLAQQIVSSRIKMLPPELTFKFQLESSEVRVDASQAHSLALVINELATNTVKHAMTDRNTVSVNMEIAVIDREISLVYTDDGPGYPTDVLSLETHNVGFDLIQNIVKGNLRGGFFLENADGASFRLTFRETV